MNDKIIITDVDDTILNWYEGFHEFLNDAGHFEVDNYESTYNIGERFGISEYDAAQKLSEYAVSDAIANLKPFRDAQEYIDLLACQGYKFVAVTNIGSDPVTIRNREKNLKAVFGEVWNGIYCLPPGSDKSQILRFWQGKQYPWVEDHFAKAIEGLRCGLKPILISHPYNEDQFHVGVTRVSNETPWYDIYRLIQEGF